MRSASLASFRFRRASTPAAVAGRQPSPSPSISSYSASSPFCIAAWRGAPSSGCCSVLLHPARRTARLYRGQAATRRGRDAKTLSRHALSTLSRLCPRPLVNAGHDRGTLSARLDRDHVCRSWHLAGRTQSAGPFRGPPSHRPRGAAGSLNPITHSCFSRRDSMSHGRQLLLLACMLPLAACNEIAPAAPEV